MKGYRELTIYEYDTFAQRFNEPGQDPDTDVLNRLGAEGWRVTAVITHETWTHYLLERTTVVTVRVRAKE